MKVFLAWSGSKSREVATALVTLLRDVIPSAKPWISTENVQAREDWRQEISRNLNSADFGVVCFTRENRQSPWLLYEVGALAARSEVLPYLIDLRSVDVPPPVAHLTAAQADKDGTWTIIETINAGAARLRLPKDKLRRNFESHWVDFELALGTSKVSGEEHLAVILVDMVRFGSLAVKGRLLADVSEVKLFTQRTQELLQSNGSVFIKNTGDGVIGFFRSVPEALECAKSIQESVKTDSTPIGDPLLQAKIAIASGTVVRRRTSYGEDIVGSPVLSAARLMSAVASGDVVISSDAVKSLTPRLRQQLSKPFQTSTKAHESPVFACRLLPVHRGRTK